MTVPYRAVVSILQLVFFVPAFLVATKLCFKHTWSISGGWYFIFMLSLLRIIGAAFETVAVYKPTTTNWTIAITCSSISLGPLILLCMGLLWRL